MPLPGNPAGGGGAFVVQRPGATSASAGPSAGTSAAVKRSSTFMQGASVADLFLPAGMLHISHVEDVEQLASSTRPAAIPVNEARDLRVIGILFGCFAL